MHPVILFLLPLCLALKSPGDSITIPGWYLQSTRSLDNLTSWSLPHANVSSWYRVGSRTTVFAGLIANKVYNESDLFYSDHLSTINEADFQIPWLYREEFPLVDPLTADQHLLLTVHGVTSRADIFLNGIQIASSDFQRGSYGGHTYDLTHHVLVGDNALLIKAYPTNYLRDLAIGFVDWNPRPVDNGTGVWRDVELKRTGPVSLSCPRVTTNFTSDDGQKPLVIAITVKTDVANYGSVPVDAVIQGTIHSPDGSQSIELSQHIRLSPRENSTVLLKTALSNPEIWWPFAWGTQPLYKINMNVSLASGFLSDIATPVNFGIRSVKSVVNSHNDTQFTVNGHPFQVLGAGYISDIFLRFDTQRLQTIFQYVLDMGLNTVRLEGKQEHPELYDLADRMGLMLIAGWECCDKWEGWTYNDDANGAKWRDEDYDIAHDSMLHEAQMMQSHPSMLAFLIGSDYWPDERATNAYLCALNRMDWSNPVIAAASKRGYPTKLGPSGMKMDGPYDWVPPNYWYGDDLGAAFGFGSEQSAGVGTPELQSLQRFLSPSDLESLWKKPRAGQYHLSPQGSVFHDRRIYNRALAARYGRPRNLKDYVSKAQIMDYEATRAEFEAFAARQNSSRPATGVIYWMLNSAWPSLHWQLFDYYLQPAGAYFGAKTGGRQEHVVYDYSSRRVYLVNHSLHAKGSRRVVVDLVGVNGTLLVHREATAKTVPLASKEVLAIPETVDLKEVAFLRLELSGAHRETLSRNVYWVSGSNDVLNWDDSTWYTTPVTSYSDFTAIDRMEPATVEATAVVSNRTPTSTRIQVVLQNQADVPAFFVCLAVTDPITRKKLAPVFWSDNYVTLFPRERLSLSVEVRQSQGWMVTMRGRNVPEKVIGRG